MVRLFALKRVSAAVSVALLVFPAAVSATETPLGGICLRCSLDTLNAQKADAPTVQTSGQGMLPEGYTRVVADSVDGQTNVEVNAKGSVIIERGDQVLNAPWAKYDQIRQSVSAGDYYLLKQGNALLSGKKLQYNLTDKQGRSEDVFIEQERDGKRFQAAGQHAEMLGENRYRLKNVDFNTCQRGDAGWFIRAEQIDADYGYGVGVARNARLMFGGVPVLYTPWADFPLNGNRKSGLLLPTVRLGSDGLTLDLPYYLNLAPNYDATVSVGGITARGARFGGEFRYLQPQYSGEASLQWMQYDRRRDKTNRFEVKVQHRQQLSDSLSLGVDVHRVSDDDYYRDFYDYAETAANVNLNNRAWLDWHGGIWGGSAYGSLQAQQYQTLANIYGYKDRSYALLPRVEGGWSRTAAGADWNVWSQFTRFQKGGQPSGSRLIVYPSVSRQFDNDWGYIRPKLGVRYAYYSIEQNDHNHTGSDSIFWPVFNVDAGMTFEREMSFSGSQYIQTLEPRLFYNYIPAREQDQLPNFDTSESSFGYNQLFSENRYSGNDRFNAANSLSAAVQTRLLDKENGTQRLIAGVGQKFYLKTDDVSLNGEIGKRSQSRSDWIAFAQGSITDSLYGNFATQYSEADQQIDKMEVGVHYAPDAGKSLSVRYKYNRNGPLYLMADDAYAYGKNRQIDVAAKWTLSRNVRAFARVNYSLEAKQFMNEIVGFEYQNDCGCWNAGISAQRYVDNFDVAKNKGEYKNAVFFSLQLKDLSNFSNGSYKQMGRSIPGYRTINEVN